MIKLLTKHINFFTGKLRASYWFIPAMMVGAAALGAFLTLNLDHKLTDYSLPQWLLLFSGGPDAARDVLSAVAGSIITVAGVTFSISIVILSLAAQQYGPRLLRNFMRDRAIHFAFGTFVATFVYSLLILPSPLSGKEDGDVFTPKIGVTVSIVLAICCVFMLIYFIHHIAQSIQASHIAAATSKELVDTIRHLHKGRVREEIPSTERMAVFHFSESDPISITSGRSGYLEASNLEELMSLAVRHDLVIEIIGKPGRFIAPGDDMAHVSGKHINFEEVSRKVTDCFILGNERTMEQDVEFGFHMLVEMAVRALSPSMNDPYTALQCIDYLRAAFRTIMLLPQPSPLHRDTTDTVRVIQPLFSVAELLSRTLPPLHHYARSSPMVLRGLTDMLESLKEDAGNTETLDQLETLVKEIAISLEG